MIKKLTVVLALGSLVCFSSCHKEAGRGGTSSISGNLKGKKYSKIKDSNAEQEVTHIIVPNGNMIDDGDYILINTPNNGTQYFIWFKWNSGVQPSPNLSGRTAIQVTYSFTESNSTVAANVASAVSAIANADFSVSVNNDIIILTNKASGEVTDADELSSNLLVDTHKQGKSAAYGSSSFVEGPIVEERVYIIYGDDSFHSDDVRTDANGHYEFKNLNRGSYTVYALSSDTTSLQGGMVMVKTNVEISDKKSIVEASELYIIQK